MFNLVKRVIALVKSKYTLNKYDNYTISEHFRNQGAQIGEDCFISLRTLASEPYLIKIGNHVGIASGVQLLTHSLGWSFRHKIPDLQLFGKIVIEDNCNIGVNAIILPDVTIGENSVIAAGAVVTKSIPPNSIVAGVPAKVIGNTDEYFEIAKKKWEIQKPNGYMSDLIPGTKYSAREFGKLRNKTQNRFLLRKHLTKLFWGKEI